MEIAILFHIDLTRGILKKQRLRFVSRLRVQKMKMGIGNTKKENTSLNLSPKSHQRKGNPSSSVAVPLPLTYRRHCHTPAGRLPSLQLSVDPTLGDFIVCLAGSTKPIWNSKGITNSTKQHHNNAFLQWHFQIQIYIPHIENIYWFWACSPFVNFSRKFQFWLQFNTMLG